MVRAFSPTWLTTLGSTLVFQPSSGSPRKIGILLMGGAALAALCTPMAILHARLDVLDQRLLTFSLSMVRCFGIGEQPAAGSLRFRRLALFGSARSCALHFGHHHLGKSLRGRLVTLAVTGGW